MLPAARALVVPWLLMLAALWGPVVYLLGAQWSFFQQYNYGWAVPVLCIYLAWERWQTGELRALSEPWAATSQRPGSNIQHSIPNAPEGRGGTSNLQSSKDGGKTEYIGRTSALNFRKPVFCLLILCGVLLWITRVLQEANPIWRAASYGLATEAVAITLLLLYLTGGKSRVKQFAFPITFFLVAVPWPTPVEGAVIQNLTRLNAAVVVELLNAFGVPALTRGNVIEVSTGVVGIDEACSGIRSVQATLMVSLFFGEFYRLRFGRRLAMVVGGLGAALVFNMARMFLLTWVASRDGTQAIEKWHDPAGVTILVACFLFLWGLGVWLGRRAEDRRRRTEGGRQASKLQAPSSNLEHPTSNREESAEPGSARVSRAQSGVPPDCGSQLTSEASPVKLVEDFTGQGSQTLEVGGQSSPSTLPPSSSLRRTGNPQLSTSLTLRRLALAVIAWMVMVEVSTEVWFRSHEVRGVKALSWSVRWPDRNPTFETKTFASTVSSMLQYDEGVSGVWVDTDRSMWQAFYLRWLPGRSFYGRMRVALAKSHNPEICLRASGLRLRTELEPVTVSVQPGFSLAFRRYVFDADGKIMHVFFSGTEDVEVAGVSGFLRMTHRERLQAALAGSRNFGQRNFEVAISGFDDPGQALRQFEARLPGLVQVGEAR